MRPVLTLDGSTGEGGGQILRTSLALAAITAQPVKLTRIRAGRDPPGLRPQHLAVAKAFAAITHGKLAGGEVGSQEVAFEPGAMEGGEFDVDIGTAGSVPLLLQALLPALAASGKFWRITATGGTDNPQAPPWDYLAKVHVNTLERIGWRPRVKLQRRGWYPRGGGGAIVEAGPWEPKAFQLVRTGKPFQVAGRIAVTDLPDHVPARIQSAVRERLTAAGFAPAAIDISHSPARDPGVVVTLWADDGACLLGASALGARGKPSEVVGAEAAEALVQEVRGPGSVDVWSSDQLLPFAALAAPQGTSSFVAREATSHARTNAWVVEQFLPVRVAFEGDERGPMRVTVARQR